MSRSLSWLDPEALAASLARAGAGGWRPAATAPHALGYETMRPARAPQVEPAPAPRQAMGGGTEAAPPPAAVAPPEFEAPSGGLAERLEAFCRWLAAATGAQGVFLADRDGLPVVARRVGDELVAASAMVTRFLELAHSRHRALAGGSLTLQLETGELVYFLQDRGDADAACLGFVVAEPVGGPTLERVRRALRRAFGGAPPPAPPRAPGEEGR